MRVRFSLYATTGSEAIRAFHTIHSRPRRAPTARLWRPDAAQSRSESRVRAPRPAQGTSTERCSLERASRKLCASKGSPGGGDSDSLDATVQDAYGRFYYDGAVIA